MDLPSFFTINVSHLTEVDMGIYARDLELPSTVSLVTDPEAPISRTVLTRVAVEEEAPAEEEEAAAEGAEAPEGEAAPTATAAPDE